MPQIQPLVKEELARESLNTHIDPDLTVAYGAASVIDKNIWVLNLWGWPKEGLI